MTHSILFVCLGNICRSPTAEAVLRKLAQDAGLKVQIDSAGTGNWHEGEPPHPPMIRAAQARGYDLSPLRARQVQPADFSRFDRIFAMDRQNLRALQDLSAPGQTQPELFLPLAPGCGYEEMPDPWYTGEFDLTIDLCEAAAKGLLRQLQPR